MAMWKPHASAAAATLALPALRLERPPWQPEARDRWTSYATLAEAAEGLPGGSRVLLTIGRKEVAPFFARRDLTLLSRMLEAPSCRLPPNARLLLSPPGETAAEERDLLQREAIDWLVSKNAGGPAAEAKLAAARSLNLPVAMIARPSKPAMETARSAAEVAAMIARRV